MKSRSIILVAALLLIACGIYLMMQKPSSESMNAGIQSHNVSMQNLAFSPSELTIKQGDTVTWTNLDSTSHTVTSDSGSELDSPALGNGGTYSHTFSTAGTFDYHCSIHPSMKGKIIVE